MPRVLVVDDDESVCTATKIVLEASGFEAVAVTDGKSALEAMRSRQFDVVIVDLFMPGMNGLDVASAIRKATPHIPIVAVSGFMFAGSCPEMPNFQAIAAEAGACATLYKPFRPHQLLQVIRDAIGMTV